MAKQHRFEKVHTSDPEDNQQVTNDPIGGSRERCARIFSHIFGLKIRFFFLMFSLLKMCVSLFWYLLNLEFWLQQGGFQICCLTFSVIIIKTQSAQHKSLSIDERYFYFLLQPNGPLGFYFFIFSKNRIEFLLMVWENWLLQKNVGYVKEKNK